MPHKSIRSKADLAIHGAPPVVDESLQQATSARLPHDLHASRMNAKQKARPDPEDMTPKTSEGKHAALYFTLWAPFVADTFSIFQQTKPSPYITHMC